MVLAMVVVGMIMVRKKVATSRRMLSIVVNSTYLSTSRKPVLNKIKVAMKQGALKHDLNFDITP